MRRSSGGSLAAVENRPSLQKILVTRRSPRRLPARPAYQSTAYPSFRKNVRSR